MFRSLIFPAHTRQGSKPLKMQKIMRKKLLKPRPKHRLKPNSKLKKHKLQQASVYPTQNKTFWVCGSQSLFPACRWTAAQFISSFYQTSFHTTGVMDSDSRTLQFKLKKRFKLVRACQLCKLVRSMMMNCM